MSVSQTATLPTLAGGLIDMDLVKGKTDTVHRRTKIICTIGPACWDVPQLETLMDGGMNVARLNFSHGDHPGHLSVLERIRDAAANKNKNVAILLDTKGPEIRTGFFADHVGKSIELLKGNILVLTSDYHYKGDNQKLACSYPQLATSVKPGQNILVADGSLVLTVLSTDAAEGTVHCRIENNAKIGERKNMNLPGVKVELPTFTEKDVDDIVNFGIKYRVDFIAPSFVRKASDVEKLRALLAENHGQDMKIICKIENQEGLENYDEILKLTDGIMVARGDLGMEIPSSKVFLAQKMMIREANIAGKYVVTATQMLESMITNPRPTRAECSDVANAVLDGSDCVMLSGETANGPYFEQAVRVMARTCCEAEHSRNYSALFAAVRRSVILKYNGITPAESLASSAVKTAIDVHANLIVVLSESGHTARLIAKYRPATAIVCLTPDPTVARQCAGVLSGVHSYLVDSLEDADTVTTETGKEACAAGIAKPGALMVVVSGTLHGTGQNNQIRVEPIIADDTTVKTATGGSMRKLNSFVMASIADEAEQS